MSYYIKVESKPLHLATQISYFYVHFYVLLAQLVRAQDL